MALCSISLSLLNSHQSSAESYTKSNQISDAVFYNYTSMDQTQIQNFINAFPKSCLLSQNYPNGLSWVTFKEPTGYSTYGDSDVSPARIIWKASQLYKINPQVILTTLEKEQSLISGLSSAGCPVRAYNSAMGYNCPDGSENALKTYPNLGITGTCVAQESNAGFSRQVNHAAWQLSFDGKRANGDLSWMGDGAVYYYGRMTQGNRSRQSGQPSTYYDGYTIINGESVFMENGATAALYNYTPHFTNFDTIFSKWFGSPITPMLTECNSKVADIACVWSARKSDGSQFLTTSKTELSNAVYTYGWTNEGIAFYASNTEKPGTIAVHRLLKNNLHYFTADGSEYTTLKNSGSWIDEGTAFYVLPPATSNASHKIYKLYNSITQKSYLTTDGDQKDYLLNSGYQLESNAFNSFSGFASLPTPQINRLNLYQLKSTSGYFYTTNLVELEATIKMGYSYEGVVTSTNISSIGTPIYRLQKNGVYLYTADTSEKNTAINKYGYAYEGVGFYIDDSSDPVYRLANINTGNYLYSSNIDKVMSLINTDGWVYESMLVDSNNGTSPVYRFLNQFNSRHFYTIDINEAARIVNKGWTYETVAFYASKNSGLPVYRLLSRDKHFYTTDINEKNNAINKYGYTYEGVVFYVSETVTDSPTYRLQGGRDEYFYTASSSERDTAVNKYGYFYEGKGFYLPATN